MRRWPLWAAAAVVLILLVLGWRGCRTAPAPPASGVAGDSTTAAPEAGATGAPGAAASAPKGPPPVMYAVTDSGVRLRIERRPRIDIPTPPFKDAYQKLQAASDQNDMVARYQLGLLLYECRDVPSTDAELEKTVDQIQQTRKRGAWDVADPAVEEQALRQSFANCAGVPDEARDRYRDALKSAADQGLMEAQLDLMYHLPKGDYCQYAEDCTPAMQKQMEQLREEARDYVRKALDAGSAEALRTVGGWALNEEMGTPDPVEAYAYFKAYDQVQKAAGRERELTNMLAGLKKQLRPIDLQRADDRAKELLSNPKCCLLTR